MKLPSRRDVCVGMIAGAFTAPLVARANPKPRPAQRSPYLIHIVLFGGMDSLLTTDPKKPAEVLREVNIEYSPGDIIEVGGRRFGPLMEPLRAILTDLTVLNGVRVSSVSHPWALQAALRLQRFRPESGTDFVEVIGAKFGTAPISTVQLGENTRPMQARHSRTIGVQTADSPKGPITTLDVLESMRPIMSRGDTAQQVFQQLGGLEAGTADELAGVEAFVSRFVASPSLPSPTRFKAWRYPGANAGDLAPLDETIPRWESVVRDIVYMLQHDLTNTVRVVDNGPWDSHIENLTGQSFGVGYAFPAILELIKQLRVTKDADGHPLAERVNIVISSELGRLPRLNQWNGKDHFPEMPMMFIGPSFVSGRTFGSTDDRTISRLLDPKSGATATSGKRVMLDDVGCTLLRAYGAEPRRFGFVGESLPFLLRS